MDWWVVDALEVTGGSGLVEGKVAEDEGKEEKKT